MTLPSVIFTCCIHNLYCLYKSVRFPLLNLIAGPELKINPDDAEDLDANIFLFRLYAWHLLGAEWVNDRNKLLGDIKLHVGKTEPDKNFDVEQMQRYRNNNANPLLWETLGITSLLLDHKYDDYKNEDNEEDSNITGSILYWK
ncbi:9042_t:CDS:2 [Entrophospora sp. SA101]|nr:5016_t:CDS:2 [Entrophospora sp. SA101]CAJ0839010.1 13111_t:CDS:2 [Entrophospora sp. SA101]CAJ0911931.1 9042_t:CDS:2 [Entrophospora sp. SA101]